MTLPEHVEAVTDFADLGVTAFTTTRHAGSFGTKSTEAVSEVMGRWDMVRAHAASAGVRRLATASQVHGARIIEHAPGWEGWLRGTEADGHLALARGTALGVTVADCVPVFLAHPSGAVALLHSGWRGTAARIVEHAIEALAKRGCRPEDLRVHLGPAVCGRCYEVSADVATRVTGEAAQSPRCVDLREVIAGQARARGVRRLTVSTACTRHDNDRFFSHRAGDSGRQVSIIYAAPPSSA